MCVEAGPFLFGMPEEYARGKAAEFPNEGGPVILAVEVPQHIIARAINIQLAANPVDANPAGESGGRPAPFTPTRP